MPAAHSLKEENKQRKQSDAEKARQKREDWKNVKKMLVISTGMALIVLLAFMLFA